jgi:hypothetical protein
MSEEWNPDISQAPYQKVLWVQNDQMSKPVKATRGYADEQGVNGDGTLFTSVYTENERFFPTPAGRLVCPTKWRLA